MRLPRFRFTIRRMMVVVAIVAVTLAADVMRRRRARFLDEASHHFWVLIAYGKYETVAENYVALHPTAPTPLPEAEFDRFLMMQAEPRPHYTREFVSRLHNLLAYHDRMRIKYERAAEYPWLPVEPDPPAP